MNEQSQPRPYKLIPVVVEALQWRGMEENQSGMLAFGNSGPYPLWGADFQINHESNAVEILTPKGKAEAFMGDWVIRNSMGGFETMSDEQFRRTYEPIE